MDKSTSRSIHRARALLWASNNIAFFLDTKLLSGVSPSAGAFDRSIPKVTKLSALHPTNIRRPVPVDGAADLTGLSVSTLNKMRLTGDGPAYLKLGRRVAYDVADLDAWMASKRRHSTSEAA